MAVVLKKNHMKQTSKNIHNDVVADCVKEVAGAKAVVGTAVHGQMEE